MARFFLNKNPPRRWRSLTVNDAVAWRGERNIPVSAVVHPPADDVLPGFPLATRRKPKTWFSGGKRRRWKDLDGTIYEWDINMDWSRCMIDAESLTGVISTP